MTRILLVGAGNIGGHILEFLARDAGDFDVTAELIDQTQPDVIINCAVLQTWHRIRQLPQGEYERLSSATLGAWLPVQLLLPYQEAQTYDGVRSIDERGVEFMEYTQEIMAEMLGFECARFTFDELEERAQEQLRRYREFEARVLGRSLSGGAG